MAEDTAGLLRELGPRARPRGRRLDGRHDRARCWRPSIPDHVRSLTSIMSTTGSRLARPARALRLSATCSARRPATATATSSARPRSSAWSARPASIATRPYIRERAGRAYDRGFDVRGGRPPARRDPRLGRPHRKLRRDHGADPGHPRHRRQDDPSLGRPGDGEGDPRRPADDDRGHGPRPAPRGLAADHRRDLRARHGRGRRQDASRRRLAPAASEAWTAPSALAIHIDEPCLDHHGLARASPGPGTRSRRRSPRARGRSPAPPPAASSSASC